MDKRFLLTAYNQKIYLRVTSLQQGSMKVKEYIMEFRLLQIIYALREEIEQTIARFLKGLNLVILEKG